MWALMGEGGGMKYCTWDGDGGLVLVRAKEGRKSMGASSCPTCEAHTTGSDLAERCDITLSCTSLFIPRKWIIATCVYFPWLFYMLPSFTKDILGTFNNNGLRMIIPSVLWAPVWPGFAQYSLESLTVLDNTLRFNYRHLCVFRWAWKDIQAHLFHYRWWKRARLSPALTLASPSGVASRCSILRLLKTIICSSDVKWETGHVNHRLKEIKADGWTTVWKRWVAVRERRDPTATFLFLVDKGTLAYAVIFPPPHFLCVVFPVFQLFPPVFPCATQQRGESGLLSLPGVPY